MLALHGFYRESSSNNFPSALIMTSSVASGRAVGADCPHLKGIGPQKKFGRSQFLVVHISKQFLKFLKIS